jgi:D-beta-D-heptose 7-phosphate kinase/D-beta-D-heptose 1-phosphate adenosyltransferase
MENRPTTVKTRVIAHSQQVVRVDHELHETLNSEEEEKIIESVRAKVAESDAVVISDYAKGLLTNSVISEAIEAASSAGKTILVDPKGKDFGKYDRATLLTPNLHEAKEACKLEGDADDLADKAGAQLLSDFLFGAVLITQGDAGMTLFQRGNKPLRLMAIAKEVYDVTGAGDTVIATLATSLGGGGDLPSACRLANIAAGIVVEQVGTTPIKIDELEKAARHA